MAACPSRVETCSDSSSRKALQQMHCSSSWQSGEAAWRSTGASNRANRGPCYMGCPPQRSLSCEGCLQLARALGWRELQHKQAGPSLNPRNLHKAGYSSSCLLLVLLQLDGRRRENPGGTRVNQPGAYSSKERPSLKQGSGEGCSSGCPLTSTQVLCMCMHAHTHTSQTLKR